MDIGESVNIGMIAEFKKKCPFTAHNLKPVDEEPEKPEDDDRDSVQSIQANNGGVLGENLVSGSFGAEGTVNGLFPPVSPPKTKLDPNKPVDTNRNGGGQIHVKDDNNTYAFVVAAHHLIPGNGSLKASEVYNYMCKGKSVSSADPQHTWEIEEHIGYNVNGAHNGVWLPGNYAIREGTSAKKKSWSAVVETEPDWCRNYVMAVVKKTRRQFHDAHPEYNDNVRDLLDKIATALLNHQVGCKECQEKKKIGPPYQIKKRLYGLSKELDSNLTGPPNGWNPIFMTSQKWKEELLARKKALQSAYEEANPG
jgi:hypothetical protein